MISALRDLWERLRRRIPSEVINTRKSLALVGVRRDAGPPVADGAEVRRAARTEDTVAAVVCVWRRPERLPATLTSLAAQSTGPVRLFIWNNNPALTAVIDETVLKTSGLDVDVVHSTRNVGGFGRFYVARTLAEEHRYVVFVDDDQVPAVNFVESLLGEVTAATVWSTWAFRFRGTRSYWDRIAASPGERVKFCATRGMICDTQIFREPGLFRCPRRFWFVEDLWLSYYADHVMGWHLFKSGAPVVTDGDAQGQFHHLGATKDIMLRNLVRRGWNPLLDEFDGS